MSRLRAAAPVLLLALACACTAGPRYALPAATTPSTSVPAAWKTTPPWQPAAPSDALARGEWWTLFGDPQLDAYEKQLLTANQSLLAAGKNLEQARSFARISTSALFPALSVDPSAGRQRGSGNRPLNGSTVPTTPYTQSVYQVPFTINYEVDVFGRVRRNIEASNALLQATAATLANTQLILTAELAADYFALRELDAEMNVVEESVGYQRKGLALVQRRHDGGIASGLEVAQQSALLDATVAQISLVRQSRAQYEHAIAALVGQTGSGFSISPAPLESAPPPLPLALPAEVLERRPDIAYAERQMAYANAQVGIARTAFYPHISLGLQGGWQSRDIATLANAPSLFWAIGADALEPVFNGGRNKASLAAAQSGYDAAVAGYRQSVLTAFQQVEDGLSNLDTLAEAARVQEAAVQDSRRELELANSRYTGGIATYLDVITAQSTWLASRRLASQLLGQRMVSSVYLVKALGGGWNAADLQKQQVTPEAKQALQP